MHIKSNRVFLIAMGIVFSLSVFAAKDDSLKPAYHAEERGVRHLLDRLAKNGIEYEVTVKHERREHYFFGHHVIDTYDHMISVPHELQQTSRAYDSGFVTGVFGEYVKDPKYSFYATIFLLSRRDEVGLGLRLEPLEKHDKALWDANIAKYTPTIFSAFSLNMAYQYKSEILFESIPSIYHRDAFSYRLIYSKGKPIIGQPSALDFKLFAKAVGDAGKGAGTNELRQISAVPEHLEVWYWLCLKGEDETRLTNLKGFLAWSRLHGGDKPFLPAVMMGLLTVDGYSFDEETGAYALNERGGLLLDYIVQFPIPENATRLKTVRDGGNRELVDGMMEKHGTERTWNTLLENPEAPRLMKLERAGKPDKL